MNKTEYFKVFFIFNFLVIFFILFPSSVLAATSPRGCQTDVYDWGVLCNWSPNGMSWANLQAGGPTACVVESTTACPTNPTGGTWSFSCQINNCVLGCNSGYTKCTDTCIQTISPPTGCTKYNTCNNCCSTCSPGWSKSGTCGTCVQATLNLGVLSVGPTSLINGSATSSLMYINTSGVGIGTNNPSSTLHVVGVTTLSNDLSMVHNKSIQLNDASADTVLLIGNYGDGQGFVYGTSTLRTASLAVEGDVKANRLCIKEDCRAEWIDIQGVNYWTASSTNIYSNNTGNVGIGDPEPNSKLSVDGNILGSNSLSITENGTIRGNLGIGNSPNYAYITFPRYVDMSGNDNVAYISRTASVTTAVIASENGAPNGASFSYSGQQMALGSLSNHPINFITNNTSKMFLTADGKLGIGTTNPTEKLQISNGASQVVSFNLGEVNLTRFTTAANGGLTINADVGGSDGTMSLQARNLTHIYLNGAGNVGIGTITPEAKLDVNGGLKVSGAVSLTGPLYTTEGNRLLMVDDDGSVTATTTLSGVSMPPGSLGQTLYYGSTGWQASSTILVRNTGNVGIGDPEPNSKLSVDGNILGSNSLSITENGTIRGNLGIGNSPNYAYITFPRYVDMSGNDNVAYISRTASVTTAVIASENGAPNGASFSYSGQQMALGSLSNHPINFITNKTSKMFLTADGKLGIGTMAPEAKLHIKGGTLKISDGDNALHMGWDIYGGELGIYDQNDKYIAGMYDGNFGYGGSPYEPAIFINEELGNVGIGTITPEAKLDVNGGLKVSGAVSLTGPLYTTEGNRLLMVDDDGSVTATTTLSGVSMPPGSLGQTLYYGSTGWQASSTILVRNTGNVGIGDPEPNSKLSVDGNILGSNSLSITENGTIRGNLGIGNSPNYAYITFPRYVDMSGNDNVAYISRTASVTTAVIASENGAPNGASFSYSGQQMALGSLSNHPINFITNKTSKMFLTADGKLGIGTTSPNSILNLYPANNSEGLRIVSSNYSPLVIMSSSSNDLFRVDQFGDVTAVTSSATRMRSNNYCDANGDNCFNPSSGWASGNVSYFATVTSSTYSGNNNNNNGYAYANGLCNSQMAGTRVCSAEGILNTIKLNQAMPQEDVWIFSGVPGYTASVNDCEARSSAAATGKYGTYWQGPNPNAGYPLGRGLITLCNNPLKLACCY